MEKDVARDPQLVRRSLGEGGRGPVDDDEATTCPRCGESHDLAKVKGCIKCLKCGFKFDCNGW